ncbi:MAG: hypothetical protein U1E20_07245 [Methylocystis sp.]|uniref:hypothetical protein n=1 Tax=Methylocystis sp. TaxID=1911079 RepID=UPI00394149E0
MILASNTYDYSAATQLLGALSLSHGNLKEADIYLQESLNSFSKFSNENFSETYIKHEKIRTYLYFISNTNDCGFAKNKMADVDTYFGAGPSIILADLTSQRQFLKANIQKYCSQGDVKTLTGVSAPPLANH